MRRVIILLTLFCAVSFSLSAQKDFFSIPSLKIGQKEYFLRWSAKTKNGRYLEEFLKKDEPFPKFECKVILECSADGSEVESEVKSLLVLLALKKEQSIVYSFQQLDEAKEGEVWVEYVQGNVQGGQPFTLEWNLQCYRMVDDRVVLLRICHRAYDKELKSFTKEVEAKRDQWISEARTFDLGQVKLSK